MTRMQEALLSIETPMTAADIAERFGFDACHTRRALTKLEKDGYVRMCEMRMVRGKPTRCWMAVGIQPRYSEPRTKTLRHASSKGSGVIADRTYARGYRWMGGL